MSSNKVSENSQAGIAKMAAADILLALADASSSKESLLLQEKKTKWAKFMMLQASDFETFFNKQIQPTMEALQQTTKEAIERVSKQAPTKEALQHLVGEQQSQWTDQSIYELMRPKLNEIYQSLPTDEEFLTQAIQQMFKEPSGAEFNFRLVGLRFKCKAKLKHLCQEAFASLFDRLIVDTKVYKQEAVMEHEPSSSSTPTLSTPTAPTGRPFKRRKKSISESKTQETKSNLEKLYTEMLNDLQQQIRDGGRVDLVIKKARKVYGEDLPSGIFEKLWSKVEAKIKADHPPPGTEKWSHLFVGEGFDASRKLEFGDWDTYEVASEAYV